MVWLRTCIYGENANRCLPESDHGPRGQLRVPLPLERREVAGVAVPVSALGPLDVAIGVQPVLGPLLAAAAGQRPPPHRRPLSGAQARRGCLAHLRGPLAQLVLGVEDPGAVGRGCGRPPLAPSSSSLQDGVLGVDGAHVVAAVVSGGH